MPSRRTASIVVVLVLSAFAIPRAVDRDRGDISGVVSDTAGGALPGVAIALTGPERRATVTDARGEFLFVNVRPGRYEVSSTLSGFSPLVTKVTVRAGRAERIGARMAAAAAPSPIAPAEDTRDAQARRRVEGGIAGGVVGGVVGGLPEAAPAPQGAGGGFGIGARAAAGQYQPGDGFIPPDYSRGHRSAESYDHVHENEFRLVTADPLSTFSIDVDTASYANVRRFLSQGTMPPSAAVRVEELINYFRYDYPQPPGGAPFSITTELASCPWNPKHRLALVGIQGQKLEKAPTPRNLVFLLDVSGSMSSPDKLPLVRNAMRMLTDVLTPRDRVAI